MAFTLVVLNSKASESLKVCVVGVDLLKGIQFENWNTNNGVKNKRVREDTNPCCGIKKFLNNAIAGSLTLHC